MEFQGVLDGTGGCLAFIDVHKYGVLLVVSDRTEGGGSESTLHDDLVFTVRMNLDVAAKEYVGIIMINELPACNNGIGDNFLLHAFFGVNGITLEHICNYEPDHQQSRKPLERGACQCIPGAVLGCANYMFCIRGVLALARSVEANMHLLHTGTEGIEPGIYFENSEQ